VQLAHGALSSGNGGWWGGCQPERVTDTERSREGIRRRGVTVTIARESFCQRERVTDTERSREGIREEGGDSRHCEEKFLPAGKGD